MPPDEMAAPPSLSVPQQAVLRLLRAYQLLLSPLSAGSCRFIPSCSAYAVEAVERFGVVRGSWLALRRVSRCRPLAAHGFDPVPARIADRRWAPRPGAASHD